MLFNKKKQQEPLRGWKVSGYTLVNHYTSQEYPFADLIAGYDETEQSLTFWHCNRYLVTIPCKTELFDTLIRMGLRRSKLHIALAVTFEAKDTQGALWTIVDNQVLACSEKHYSLAGLRFRLNDARNIKVYFYGKLLATLVCDDLKTLEKAKSIFMARKYLRVDGRYSSAPEANTLVSQSSVKACQVGLSTESVCLLPNCQRVKVISSHTVCKVSPSLNGTVLSSSLTVAKESVLSDLRQLAASCGANAVFAVSMQYQAPTQAHGNYVIHATGTAFRVLQGDASDLDTKGKSALSASIFAPTISIDSLVFE